jgi:hypothetical protein
MLMREEMLLPRRRIHEMSKSTGYKPRCNMEWELHETVGDETDGTELRSGMVRQIQVVMGWLYQVAICTVTIETKVDEDGKVCERRELRSYQWSQPVYVRSPG